MKKIPVLLLFCILFSCAPEDSAPEPNKRINDEWVYQHTKYDEAGNITSTHTYTFKGVEHLSGGTSFVYLNPANNLTDSIFSPAGGYTLKTDGLWQSSFIAGIEPYLFLKYPGNPGEQATFNPTNNGIITTEILSNNETVTLPSGLVPEVYKYSVSYNMEVSENIWFNSILWIIRSESIDSLSDGSGVYTSSSLELVSYVPG